MIQTYFFIDKKVCVMSFLDFLPSKHWFTKVNADLISCIFHFYEFIVTNVSTFIVTRLINNGLLLYFVT